MLLCEALTAIFMVKSVPIMEPRANIKPGTHHTLSKKMNMATATATVVNAIGQTILSALTLIKS